MSGSINRGPTLRTSDTSRETWNAISCSAGNGRRHESIAGGSVSSGSVRMPSTAGSRMAGNVSTAYCLLPTAYCLLPIAYCLLRQANHRAQRLTTLHASEGILHVAQTDGFGDQLVELEDAVPVPVGQHGEIARGQGIAVPPHMNGPTHVEEPR